METIDIHINTVKTNKSPDVQILRAATFLIIFVAHWFTFFTWGAFGVSSFIVLSGYLEAKRHLYDEKLRMLPFTIRKISQIYPLHLAMTFCAIPISLLGIWNWNQIVKFIAKLVLNLLLAQSWVPIPNVYFSLNAVSWYLTLVVFFALLTPKTMRIIRNLDTKRLSLVVLALIVFEFILGLFSHCLPASHWLTYVSPITRYADFFIGGGTYKLLHNKVGWRTLNLGVLISTVLLVLSIGFDDTHDIFSSAVWIIPTILIVSSTCELKRKVVSSPLFIEKVLVWIGNISMELFLIHQLVIRYVQLIFKYIGLYSNWLIIPSFFLTVAIAIVWRIINNSMIK